MLNILNFSINFYTIFILFLFVSFSFMFTVLTVELLWNFASKAGRVLDVLHKGLIGTAAAFAIRHYSSQGGNNNKNRKDKDKDKENNIKESMKYKIN
jgi:hypothetical protein